LHIAKLEGIFESFFEHILPLDESTATPTASTGADGFRKRWSAWLTASHKAWKGDGCSRLPI